jgi:hypothetical protein
MSDITTADTIAAPGTTITLSTGATVSLRYTFSALAELEREHGSVNGLVVKLNKGEKGPVFATLCHALWAASQRKIPAAAFLDLLDPARLSEYTTAFSTALSLALGGDSEGEAEAATAA